MPESGSRRSRLGTVTASQDGGRDLAVDVGVLVAHSPQGDPDGLSAFAARMASDAVGELADATEATWRFHEADPERLGDAAPRSPSAFLDEASLRMGTGPYDVVVVVTDVPVVSRSGRQMPGLASPVSRIAVVSTRRLRVSSRDQPHRPLDAPAVRWNGAALLLHLLGHVLGATHSEGDGVMAPFRVNPDRDGVPAFDAYGERHLRRVATHVPEPGTESRGAIGRVWFHLASAARNPDQLLRALVRSRGLLLPLDLPKLSTAALAPTLVLVFSAETWDVGIHLTDGTAALFAAVSVVAAALYLRHAHDLAFPRGHDRPVTEHTALVNVVVLLVLLSAAVGLFVLVGTVMLFIELVVFPPDLMTNWPSLENPAVGIGDLVRTAAFIASLGVLSGALGGGLESRTFLGHLALFLDHP